MSLFSESAIRIQPFFGYSNATRLVLTARALRSGKPDFENRGRLRAIRTMIAQFASREVPDLPVTLEIEHPDTGLRHRFPAVTNQEGFAHFDIALPDGWAKPGRTCWDVVALHWEADGEEHCVEGHVLEPGANERLGVISDIDDTIIETGITGSFRQIMRNWRRVIAELPEERIAVPGADTFFSALGGGAVLGAENAKPGERLPATHRPFFYISSSPWNLYSYLVSFQQSRNLPLGPLMLRDWGFDRETLGSASHGKHKRAALDQLLSAYPDIRFALIGDDTQGDLAAYGDVVADHPHRIAAIFIRSAAGPLSPEEVAAKATIEAAGVPFWLGESFDVGQDFLRATGLASEGETSKIVEAVEKAHGIDNATGTAGE